MKTIEKLLISFIEDPENYNNNFQLAQHYDNIDQTAAAVSYYLRAAERSTNVSDQYYCLIKSGICFMRQGCRNFTVQGIFQQAVAIMPSRPEVYYLLSRVYNEQQKYHDAYMIASMGEKVAENSKECPDLEYPGRYAILYEKAISSYEVGLCDDSRELLTELKNNGYNTEVVTEKLNEMNHNAKGLHDVYIPERYQQFSWFNFHDLKTEQQSEIFIDDSYQKYVQVEEGDLVVDVGAGIGAFAFKVKEKNPKKVYCFEPDISKYQTLIGTEYGDNIECINYLSSVKLFSEIVTKKFQHIDFLKLDCGGGEYDILSQENLPWVIGNVKKISGKFNLGTPELNKKFVDFKNTYLKTFTDFQVYSLDGVDIKGALLDDDGGEWFLSYYHRIFVHINNPNSKLNVMENTIEDSKTKVLDVYKDNDGRFGEWGWCSNNKAGCIIDVIDEICNDTENPVCVEIGAYGGKSIIPVALELKRHGKGTIHAIDPWTIEEATRGYDGADYEWWSNTDLEFMHDIFLTTIQETETGEHVDIHEMTSDDAPEFERIDYLYIDGQHTKQAFKDADKYATKVRPGGYCFVDDIDWTILSEENLPGYIVGLGFEFINRVDNAFIYRKKEEPSTNIFSLSVKQKPTSWTVDNFLQDPDAVREFALQQQFHEGGWGRGHIGRRTNEQFLFPGLKERFEEIMGKRITKWEEHTENGKFQNCVAGEPLVYHCDSQQWGGLLYLSPEAPYSCGTTLYAHKESRARTYNDPGYYNDWCVDPELGEEIYYGGIHCDGTKFEPVDVIGNVYNRLILFDASCIHSASEYFGYNLKTGRLWQMFFFDAD